jgi:polysaccharide export outer membrane protein
MLQPVSYLLAQKFDLQNKDVVYIAGAEANQPGKLLQMIGQVFTPLVIARQITN